MTTACYHVCLVPDYDVLASRLVPDYNVLHYIWYLTTVCYLVSLVPDKGVLTR